MQVHIRKARIIDPRSDLHNQVADLLINDGIITEIGGSINAPGATVVEADGLCVSPGWVDVFADYSDPGYEHKETIESGLAAAAAGGFTHVLLAPNTQPVTGNKSTVQYLLQRAAGNAVTLLPTGSATRNTEGKELAEMLDMYHHGAVAFGDGWKPIQESNLALKALEYVKAFDGTIIQLPIDASIAKGGLMHEGATSTRLGMAGTPALGEAIFLHRDLELLRYTQSRLHVTGISTSASVAMIRKAKAEGLRVTCSVTPYHLMLTDEALTSYDSVYKVSPPLRSEDDRQALIAGLKDGTIDCIASHHHAQDWDAKTREFEYAAEGMALQESAYCAVWTAVQKATDIERVAEALSVIPRDIFGLPHGIIERGADASVTLFTAAGTTTPEATGIRSASRNNPFIGKTLSGRVIGIYNNKQLHLNK